MPPPCNTPIKKYNYERSLFRWVMARHPEPFEKQGITTRTLERAPRAREAFYTSDWSGARSLVRITAEKKFERTPLLDGIIDRGLQGCTRFRIDHITDEERAKLGIYQDSVTGKYFLESYGPQDGRSRRPLRHSQVMKEVEDMVTAGVEAVGRGAKVDVAKKVCHTQGRSKVLHITISITKGDGEGSGESWSAVDDPGGGKAAKRIADLAGTLQELRNDEVMTGSTCETGRGEENGKQKSLRAMVGTRAGVRGGAKEGSWSKDMSKGREKIGAGEGGKVGTGMENRVRTRAARDTMDANGCLGGAIGMDYTNLGSTGRAVSVKEEGSTRRPIKRPYHGMGTSWECEKELSKTSGIQSAMGTSPSWPIPRNHSGAGASLPHHVYDPAIPSVPGGQSDLPNTSQQNTHIPGQLLGVQQNDIPQVLPVKPEPDHNADGVARERQHDQWANNFGAGAFHRFCVGHPNLRPGNWVPGSGGGGTDRPPQEVNGVSGGVYLKQFDEEDMDLLASLF
ncbi:unnamed protein product [Choristocarpus tenellus]